jgi:PAS domain S-box-containing protein
LQRKNVPADNFGFRLLISTEEYLWLSDITLARDHQYIYITASASAKKERDEIKIIEANHILNEVINLVPHPIFLKDENGKYLLVNQAQSALFSLEANDLLGKDDAYFIKDQKQYEGVLETDSAVLNKHIMVDIAEQLITTPKGERKLLHTTKAPLFSTDGKVYILGVSIDLTDLKKYQEALQQNEEKYRSLVELSPDAIIILKNGKISFVNDSGIKLLGASSIEELNGKMFLEFIHPDYYSVIIERNKLLKKGERVSAIEEKFIRIDGSTINVEVSSIPFYYENRFAIQIIARDITDRLKTRNSLYKRKQEFQALAENSSDIIARFNKNYEHLYINKSVTKYTSKPPEYFINRKVNEDYPKSLYRNVEKIIDEVFIKGRTITRYFILPTDQGIQYCFATIVPERDKNHQIVSVLCTVRDITKLKLKEKELIRINRELNTFIYKASHDLKGPLSTILGLSKLADYAGLNHQEIYGLIHATASNLNETLRKLLEIVKIKDCNLNFRNVDLHEMVRNVAGDLEKEPGTKSVKFSSDIRHTVKFRTDPEILSSVIKNLLKNAIDYKNDHASFVKISSENFKEGLMFSIEDNGQGMEEKVKSRIFDMFFRGNVNSKGSGLGLYLVKIGVLRLKGSIEFESEINKGSKFSVYIPISHYSE